MTADIALVLGIVMILLMFPAAVSAFSSDRSQGTTAFLGVVGGGLILFAMATNPAGYRAGDLPQVVMRVITSLTR